MIMGSCYLQKLILVGGDAGGTHCGGTPRAPSSPLTGSGGGPEALQILFVVPQDLRRYQLVATTGPEEFPRSECPRRRHQLVSTFEGNKSPLSYSGVGPHETLGLIRP